MSEWISVEDRMPVEDQRIVFAEFYQWGDGPTEFAASAAGQFWNGSFHLDKDGLEAENFDGYATITLDFKPTHWMPLPEPPKN
ncbi:MAG: DUF551 domain-containing protein [Plesiomonas sp.]